MQVYYKIYSQPRLSTPTKWMPSTAGSAIKHFLTEREAVRVAKRLSSVNRNYRYTIRWDKVANVRPEVQEGTLSD